MITKVRVRKFKRFRQETIDLLPTGISLLAGGNNAGKSTLLHALAIWEFCRTAIEMEKGAEAFLVGAHDQGQGLGDDEFSPIAVPSLKHLWTNLRPQRRTEDGDTDGYTLRIACHWTGLPQAADDPATSGDGVIESFLEFGLALSNDRLFVKVTDTNLSAGAAIPIIAYLPPFAGISNRETRMSAAIRRRRTGEGLAGAVLRNLLLDLFNANELERARLQGDRPKILDSDLRRLRQTDSWELLQQTLRQRFRVELVVDPFKEEYHSYIKIDLIKGELSGYQLKKSPDYNKRDLMVEGSGFLQWLSVYALATSPSFDVLLLDEPDAHLHPTLQVELMQSLEKLASLSNKQVLVATHSVELLRHWPVERILEVRASTPATRYLRKPFQKTALLSGLGSEYGPNLDPVRKVKRLLFLEGQSDRTVLEAVAKVLGRESSLEKWPIWINNRSHADRKQLALALRADTPNLKTVSLRDRDEAPASTVRDDLTDKSANSSDGFIPLTWRRREIENYLLVPEAIARVRGVDPDSVRAELADEHSLAIASTYFRSDCPDVLLHADGKNILWKGPRALLQGQSDAASKVAEVLQAGETCADFDIFFDRLDEAAAED